MKTVIIFYYLCHFVSASFNEFESEKFISEFKEHLIVPHLLPSFPNESCSVIYEPGLIILTGKPYFPYQIQGLPDISWSYKDDTFYTVIILGAFQEKIEYVSTTSPVLNNETIVSRPPPEYWWHHWVKVNVYENDLSSTGTILQPFVESATPQPNSTHDIIYAFAVYQQNQELEFKSDDANNSPRALLQKYFTPISNFENQFKESVVFLAGNFFYAVPKKIVLDTSVVRRIRWKD